ncbi:hypothetical protein [Streptomyces sp. CA-106110]
MRTGWTAAWSHRLAVYSYDVYVHGEGAAAVTDVRPTPTTTFDEMGLAHD